MMRNLLILLLFIPCFSFSQKTLKYDGPYNVGLKLPGNASYSYILDANKKQVKQGSFRYTVKVKEEEYRVNHAFSGNYSNGNKNGAWTYQINTKDYNKDDQGYFYSLTLLMTANYNQGLPDGKWNYSVLEQKRKKVRDKNEMVWSAYETVKDVKISIEFKDGLLVDSISIIDKLGFTISIITDDGGFVKDSFLVHSPTKNMEFVFDDGFLLKSLEKDGSWKSYSHHGYYLKNKALEGKSFKLETRTYFTEKGCLVRKYLDENVFNPNYFMFRYIEGDKIIIWDNSNINFNVDYKGLYYNELTSELNANENFKIQGIYKSKSNVERIYNEINGSIKNSTNKDDMISRRDRVGVLLDKIKSIACLANSSKTEFMIDELKLISDSSCKNSFPAKPIISTREELLNILFIEAQKIESEAEKI